MKKIKLPKQVLFDTEHADVFVGMAPKSTAAKDITELFVKLNHWTKMDAAALSKAINF